MWFEKVDNQHMTMWNISEFPVSHALRPLEHCRIDETPHQLLETYALTDEATTEMFQDGVSWSYHARVSLVSRVYTDVNFKKKKLEKYYK